MNKIPKPQFKALALETVLDIDATGRALVITDNGEPRIEIRRYRPPSADPLDALRGSVVFFDPETIEFGT